MVVVWVYQIIYLFLKNSITLNFRWLAIPGVAGHISNFSQNVRDGEQSLLLILNLIYSAHNGGGMGLLDYLPFLQKFDYIEF